jgi:hypothetical protein
VVPWWYLAAAVLAVMGVSLVVGWLSGRGPSRVDRMLLKDVEARLGRLEGRDHARVAGVQGRVRVAQETAPAATRALPVVEVAGSDLPPRGVSDVTVVPPRLPALTAEAAEEVNRETRELLATVWGDTVSTLPVVDLSDVEPAPEVEPGDDLDPPQRPDRSGGGPPPDPQGESQDPQVVSRYSWPGTPRGLPAGYAVLPPAQVPAVQVGRPWWSRLREEVAAWWESARPDTSACWAAGDLDGDDEDRRCPCAGRHCPGCEEPARVMAVRGPHTARHDWEEVPPSMRRLAEMLPVTLRCTVVARAVSPPGWRPRPTSRAGLEMWADRVARRNGRLPLLAPCGPVGVLP